MVKRVREDVEKKLLGKDPETNIFTALSKSKENIGGAIAQSNEDNKEYFASIMQMVQGLEVAINDIESQKRQDHPDDNIFSLPESTEEAISRILSQNASMMSHSQEILQILKKVKEEKPVPKIEPLSCKVETFSFDDIVLE